MRLILCMGVVFFAALGLSARADTPTNCWSVDLSPASWKAAPETIPGSQLYQPVIPLANKPEPDRPQPTQPGFDLHHVPLGLLFTMLGNVPERRSMTWVSHFAPRDLSVYDYCMLRYEAGGIARDYTPIAVITLSGKDASSKPMTVPLLDASWTMNDGKRHSVLRKRKLNLKADTIEVRMSIEDSSAYLALGELTFSSSLPVEGAANSPGVSRKSAKPSTENYQPVDLQSLYNDSLGRAVDRCLASPDAAVVDGMDSFVEDSVVVDGIPFKVNAHGNNIVHLSENAAVNNETVEVLGAKVPRWSFRPIGRDDRTEISIARKACEVYLLLVCELPATHAAYATPPRPYKIDDIEGFAVELQYADGESDFAFPYSIADEGYILQRMIGAYVVPADAGRELKKVVLHNRHWGKAISVAAVTLNISQRPQFAKLWDEPKPLPVPQLKTPPARKPYVTRTGEVLRLGNSYYEMVVDCTHGFAIKRLIHRWAGGTEVSLNPDSGLEIIVGNHSLSGKSFSTKEIEVKGNTARVTLQSMEATVPLRLEVEMTIDNSKQVKMRLTATNIGASTLNASIHIPCLKDLKLGNVDGTWIFFPQYRNVITNRAGFHRAANDRGFAVQFFDVYNPLAGIGAAFITHNLDRTPLEYTALKDTGGVTGYIRYPADLRVLAPGQTVRFPETALDFHAGDWHTAMSDYRDWVVTWYRPVRPQDREWFKKIFLIRTHITSENYSWMVNRTPGSFDPHTGKYRIDEIAKIDKEFNGALPDAYHFFNWFLLERKTDWLNYGDYSTETYKSVGGLPAFKAAIGKLQDEYKIPVSVYLIPDRCSKSNESGKKYGERFADRRADGSPEADAETWYMCLGATEWQNYFVQTIQRVQKETGARIMYVDVFPRERGWRCYSTQHGHGLPFSMDMGTLDLIRKIRAALPPEVAIWTEFPFDDVSSQYADGNITYNFMDMGREAIFAKSRDIGEEAPLFTEPVPDVYRYLFPNLRQFALPCGIEGEEANWGQLKQILFNGEPAQDVTWRLYSDRGLAMLNKSFAIKRKFADCFATDKPAPLVETLRGDIYANKFPGDGRTVWTLFNSRNQTVRGAVIAVPHHDGDNYYDVWNDKPLSPKIEKGRALISLTLDPQGLGCIVQTRRK